MIDGGLPMPPSKVPLFTDFEASKTGIRYTDARQDGLMSFAVERANSVPAALQKASERWPVDVWAYVLMPEHVHLLVSPRKPKLDLGRFNGFVKEHTARPAIKWLKDNAPEFLPRITVIEGSVTRRHALPVVVQ